MHKIVNHNTQKNKSFNSHLNIIQPMISKQSSVAYPLGLPLSGKVGTRASVEFSKTCCSCSASVEKDKFLTIKVLVGPDSIQTVEDK